MWKFAGFLVVGLGLTAAGLAQSVSPATQPGRSPGLRFTRGPQNASEAVLAALKRPFVSGRAPELADTDKLTLKPPLAIYNLNAAEVANGKGFETAVATGEFQYLVDVSGKTSAAVTVTVDPSGARATRVSAGPEAQPYGNALDQLSASDSIRTGSFEVRVVHASGLMGSGVSRLIWLKSDEGGTDLIYPMAPNPNLRAPGGFQLDKLYTVDDFLTGVRPIAQRQQSLGPGRSGRGTP